jgi:hypothetical protein
MGVGDTFALYSYISDDGNTYLTKMSALVAAAGGFGGPFPLGSYPVWPFHRNDLRHVDGKTGDGTHARLAIASASNALFTTGGTFSLHSKVYEVEGRSGERRWTNHIK